MVVKFGLPEGEVRLPLAEMSQHKMRRYNTDRRKGGWYTRAIADHFGGGVLGPGEMLVSIDRESKKTNEKCIPPKRPSSFGAGEVGNGAAVVPILGWGVTRGFASIHRYHREKLKCDEPTDPQRN